MKAWLRAVLVVLSSAIVSSSFWTVASAQEEIPGSPGTAYAALSGWLIPDGCAPRDFPVSPRGPSVAFSHRVDGFPAYDGVIWREPCTGDPTQSLAMMRVTPVGTGMSLCGTTWAVYHAGRVLHPVHLRSDALDRFCNYIRSPFTVAFNFEIPAGFDRNAAFVLSNSSRLGPPEIKVPAYAPTLVGRSLSVTLTGTGAGRVEIASRGWGCTSGTCTVEFAEGTAVMLDAVPAAGGSFGEWKGHCAAAGTSPRVTLTIAGNTACTARFLPPKVDPESGWWWAPAEPGRAYSIELRDGRLLMASYTYRPDGSAAWYSSLDAWDGYELTTALTEFHGAGTIGGVSQAPTELARLGAMTLSFSSTTRGTLTWIDGRRITIERFSFGTSPSPDTPSIPTAGDAPIARENVRLQALRDLVISKGAQQVIVRLHGSGMALADGQRMNAMVMPSGGRVVSTFRALPMAVVEVTPAGLETLLADPAVASVHEDVRRTTFLAATVPKLRAPQLWAEGHAGRGQTVAVLDTGIDGTHPFFGGRVVDEACFSTSIPAYAIVTACPNGAGTMIGRGAARPCADMGAGCYHGTHVAGIVAGRGDASSGVAPEARLMGIQVFRHYPAAYCWGPCIGATDSDIIRGLEYVRDNAARWNVAAVNLSLGGGSFAAYCDDEPHKPVIDQLKTLGVATVIASGNDGETGAIAAPACISSAVAVGATTKADALAPFSNEWSRPMILAPGDGIVSAMPGGGFASLRGTSMAAPHVAGAVALLKGAHPTAGVGRMFAAMRESGPPVPALRPNRTYRRIDLADAHEHLIQPETGWWWNAADPATGYFMEVSGASLFLSTHLFRDDGRAVWHVATGAFAHGLFQGPMLEYDSGAAAADRGTVTLRVQSPNAAFLTLADGREVQLTRLAF